MGSRIAVCCWSLGVQGPGELISTLRGTPIDALQLALSPLAGIASVADDVARIRDAGIEVVSGMLAFAGEDYSTLDTIARTGGVRRDEAWPEHRAHAASVAALAEELGIDLVTFHAGFIPESRDGAERARLLDRLREVTDLFADRGARVALETGQETATTLRQALADLDRPELGVNFDPANMILYGKGDPVAALRMLADRVLQIHVKDAIPTATPGTWGCEVPVGDGAVDWPAFFEVATAIDPPVDFVIEREAGENRVADIVQAHDLTARFVK
ncbi:MAG: sugar phosphate isomerase/epimerase [Planctomycetes bacterium]|nr:sugar phosphate isomerase/epimerase [Planctomycetota bacterium]